MKDLHQLKELILNTVDLTEVMIGYGVEFVYNPRAAKEVQYRCPFHGKDNKPSARLYKETKSCWCWKCHKYWDVIDFVKDKENLKYTQAVLHIIDKYRVDTSSIPDMPSLEEEKPVQISEQRVELIRVRDRIREMRGKIPYEKYAALCTAWLMISYTASLGKNTMESLSKLDMKVNTL